MCDLGTLGSLVRFFILSGYKMHHNDLKCWEIVDDFYYIQKTVCSVKEDFGWGMWANCGPLVKKIRIWAVMKSNGHNITRN